MPKKTKAQLEEERLQREEEERKAKLIEEKRLAEEAEKKRLEDIRIKEERRVFREGELLRLHEEQRNLFDMEKTREQQLRIEEEYDARREEWEAYRNPVDSSENMSESDINTFLSLCEENNSQDWKEIFEFVQTIQRVGQSIEYKWSESLVTRNYRTQLSTEANIHRCFVQIFQKLDRATANLLRFTDSKLNDRSELHIEEYSKEVSIGIWGSYADIRPIRKSIIFDKQGIQIDVPKQILQHDACFLFRLIRLSLDPYTLHAYRQPPILQYDSNRFTVIGDIISLDILRPPPQAYNLRAKRWIIRDKTPTFLNIQKSHYPSSVNCKVLMKVPDEVIMSDDVTLMWYDNETNSWKTDGITDFQYTESNKTAQFYVTIVGIFALVKERTNDFPYKKWSMSPIRQNNLPISNDPEILNMNERVARFSITTQGNIEIVIDIVGTKVKLIRPGNRQLSDLINVELTIGALLRTLAKRGINLLPISPPSSQLKKDEILEDTVMRHIARNASCLDFEGSTPWNDYIGKSQIGLHVRETTTYYGGLDTFNYDCVLAELDSESFSHIYANEVGTIDSPGVKFSLVMGNEYGMSKKYSHALRPNEVSHCEFMLTMTNRITPETIERYHKVNVKFEKAVYYFLRMVKPISFS